MDPVERDVSVGGGRFITIQTAGDPEGLPVFVHHGTPCSRALYGAWVEDATERGIHLIGFDRAGYGNSTRAPGRSVGDVAADVTAIADDLGFDRFATWGISGGGPHALACAALLPDRVTGAASLAGVAPWDAEGLDYLAGMGETNHIEFNAAVAGEDKLRPLLESFKEEILASDPHDVPENLESLMSEVDLAVHSGEMAQFLYDWTAEGLTNGIDGWLDDDLAFVKDWGFDLAAISIPVLIWQGKQDRFVPLEHGRWLAEHVPGAEPRLTDDDGHLTLIQGRVADTHAWLLGTK